MKRRKKSTINVSILTYIVLTIFLFLIVIKLSLIALEPKTDGVDLTKLANSRSTRKEVIKSKRGNIYSANGETLAQSIAEYKVVAILSPKWTKDPANPHHVVDKEKTATELSKILGGEKEYYLNRLNQELYQVEFGNYGHVNSLVKKQIESLGLPGITFIEGTKRFYPNSSLAPYIIGYARTNDDGVIRGEMGIESYYNKELQGKDGFIEYQKDAYGYIMPNTPTIEEKAEHGKDIELTIDTQMQMFVENGIKDITEKNKMDWLTFSVMNAKTGAIVASGSSPTFNLNTLQIENYLNPLTEYQYEPGSTMKIYSFLAAMENGIYDGNKKYKSGTIRVDDSIIKDFNLRGWGTITFDEGFSYSSNVAATNLALELGREKLYNYYASLGFGKRTGITLPNEMKGNIDFTYKTEIATAAFGQGITTTPIQNLQALSVVTNDGIEIQPYIVERITDTETGKDVYKHKRKELGRKAKPEHAKKMLDMLYDVVYSGKTDAGFFKAKNVTLVGKTGTAQIAGPNGKYQTGKYDYIRSFTGVFPYEDPEYIIYISVKKFRGNFRDVAKMVTKVVEEIAKYKNITELTEEVDKTKIITIDNYISDEVEKVEEKLKKAQLNYIKIGNGKYITNQYPTKGNTIVKDSKIFIITNDSEYLMPDITNWSNNEVVTLCKLLKINYEITGYGRVKTFNIEPNTKIEPKTVLKVTLG